MYEVFEHTADLGLRMRAEDLPSLMVEAAHGFLSLVVTDPHSVRPVLTEQICIEGDQHDYLLFDWLNELLYRFETRMLLLCQFEVQLTEAGLNITARGERYDPPRHVLDHEVKAITYHGLKVVREANHWIAEVIVDI